MSPQKNAEDISIRAVALLVYRNVSPNLSFRKRCFRQVEKVTNRTFVMAILPTIWVVI